MEPLRGLGSFLSSGLNKLSWKKVKEMEGRNKLNNAWWLGTKCYLGGLRSTYHPVLVKDFDDDCWWFIFDLIHFSIHDHLVEDKHLVPGRAQCFIYDLCALALVPKHHAGEWIRKTRSIRANKRPCLVHVCPQLEYLLLWIDKKKSQIYNSFF